MYKLIIVDDEKNIREGLAECYPWEELGFEVAAVLPDGKSAMEYIERYCVHAVLSDIRMPKLDGLELAKRLFSDYPGISVVLLSGYTEFEYARTAIHYGVKDYILKPVKYESIIDIFTTIRKNLDAENGVGQIKEPVPGYYDQIVEQVIGYIKENFKDAALEDASALVSLSPNYLSKVFKRKTGVNFSEYLMRVKMENAARLLKNVTMKTYEVAFAVGYDNPKNFTRAFKQYFGKNPREFREQDRKL